MSPVSSSARTIRAVEVAGFEPDRHELDHATSHAEPVQESRTHGSRPDRAQLATLSPLRQDVLRGIERQEQVELKIHRVIGAPRPDDRCRLDTIVRARNEGRKLGSSHWVMYLDDDVVMAPRLRCSARPVASRTACVCRPGADCAGEMRPGWENWDYPLHVGMAATLFRREQLIELTFRWEPGKCECRCCCDDLRRGRSGIGYLPAPWHGTGPWHDGKRPCHATMPNSRQASCPLS